MRIPATWGECADLLFELRQRKAAAQRKVDAIEEEEQALRKHVVEHLPRELKGTGVQGRRGKIEVIPKDVPRAEDWDKVYAWIKRTGGFDILQRRFADAAVRERWAEKQAIPGLTKFTVLTVSVTVVKKR